MGEGPKFKGNATLQGVGSPKTPNARVPAAATIPPQPRSSGDPPPKPVVPSLKPVPTPVRQPRHVARTAGRRDLDLPWHVKGLTHVATRADIEAREAEEARIQAETETVARAQAAAEAKPEMRRRNILWLKRGLLVALFYAAAVAIFGVLTCGFIFLARWLISR